MFDDDFTPIEVADDLLERNTGMDYGEWVAFNQRNRMMRGAGGGGGADYAGAYIFLFCFFVLLMGGLVTLPYWGWLIGIHMEIPNKGRSWAEWLGTDDGAVVYGIWFFVVGPIFWLAGWFVSLGLAAIDKKSLAWGFLSGLCQLAISALCFWRISVCGLWGRPLYLVSVIAGVVGLIQIILSFGREGSASGVLIKQLKTSWNKKLRKENLHNSVFLRRGDKTKGPIHLNEARKLFIKGEIKKTDEVSNNNDGPWFKLSKTVFFDKI